MANAYSYSMDTKAFMVKRICQPIGIHYFTNEDRTFETTSEIRIMENIKTKTGIRVTPSRAPRLDLLV